MSPTAPELTGPCARTHTCAQTHTDTYIPSLSFWCGDVWTSRKSHPLLLLTYLPPSTDAISSPGELNFNEKIIWNWKCKIIKSSIKSNEKFNESRKGGLSGTHQSERSGAAPRANRKQRHRRHICCADGASSPLPSSISFALSLSFCLSLALCCLDCYCKASGAEWCTAMLLPAPCALPPTHTHTHTHTDFMSTPVSPNRHTCTLNRLRRCMARHAHP